MTARLAFLLGILTGAAATIAAFWLRRDMSQESRLPDVEGDPLEAGW